MCPKAAGSDAVLPHQPLDSIRPRLISFFQGNVTLRHRWAAKFQADFAQPGQQFPMRIDDVLGWIGKILFISNFIVAEEIYAV